MHKTRDKIFKLVEKYYKDNFSEKKFIPGKTKINYAGRVFDEKEMTALIGSSLDFWLTLGENGKKFEEKFAEYLNLKHTIVTNSGSSANLLAVSALCTENKVDRINAGDEVITTAVNFPTTVAPIVQNRLIPVFVDVDNSTYNIDTTLIESAVSKKTKAIFIAHTLGNPVNLTEILRIKKKYGLYLIEDTCDALDSRFENRLVGTWGELSTFSFYAAHHMTMGEGGAVATNSPEIYKLVLSLRDWGRDCWCPTGEKNTHGACRKRFGWNIPGLPEGYDHKYTYSSIGYNLKPLDLQCAIGLEQLKKLPGFTKLRKSNFKKIYEIFKPYEEYFILPKAEKNSDPSWFAFPLTVKKNGKFSKNDFIRHLEDGLIETRAIFAGNILKHPGYRNIQHRVAGSLSNSDNILYNSFFIGVYPGITEEHLAYIKKTVDIFFKVRRG